MEATCSNWQFRHQGVLQAIQNTALMRRVLVEHINIGSQQVSGIKMRKHLFHISFDITHQFLNCRVHINDVVILISQHHVGRHRVHCSFYTRCRSGLLASIHYIKAQFDLGHFNGLQHFADFIIPIPDLDPVEIITLRDFMQLVTGIGQGTCHVTGQTKTKHCGCHAHNSEHSKYNVLINTKVNHHTDSNQ